MSDTQCHGRVLLLGLDFGSTTSSVLISYARPERGNQGTVLRCNVQDVVYRPAPVFTPFSEHGIDAAALGALLDGWLAEAGIDASQVFAGGALVTGLAAQQSNAQAIAALISERLGEQLLANAGEPALESWLAFMGGSAALSRLEPDCDVLNLDIGGGTTNPALGRDGQVLSSGCYDIGARHLRFVPGSYRLSGLSPQGKRLLLQLGLPARCGDTLSHDAVAQVTAVYVRALEALVSDAGLPPAWRWLGTLPLQLSRQGPRRITFSGGVGELLYAHSATGDWPETSCYGDLGVALAQAIARSPVLSRDLHSHCPPQRGRATVCGLALNSSEVSGASLFLPQPSCLPLRNLPVLGTLRAGQTPQALRQVLALADSCQSGVCFQYDFGCGQAMPGLAQIRCAAAALAEALKGRELAAQQPLVLLLRQNAGKVFGNYVTDWGRSHRALVVIDEVAAREARFVHIGRSHRGMVPVSYFGL
ncbi:ethanolamine ammonia-lyase reactivating factor EutA [Granulosicoccaceae sp. 1_MG-2023]|nr:ethanolamine ammonia-lyase reactivating factor EutA [Granulosicoccaceae sp. 1_MG-2023]